MPTPSLELATFKEVENAIGKFLFADTKLLAGTDRRMGKFW
jgi:hypothetical protein